jgi:hypothetical protein
MTFERRRRIAVEGSSYGGGEVGKVDLLGVEHILAGHAAPIGEMVHWGEERLFEQFINPETAGRGRGHLGRGIGLGLGISRLRSFQRAAAPTGAKPDGHYQHKR